MAKKTKGSTTLIVHVGYNYDRKLIAGGAVGVQAARYTFEDAGGNVDQCVRVLEIEIPEVPAAAIPVTKFKV